MGIASFLTTWLPGKGVKSGQRPESKSTTYGSTAGVAVTEDKALALPALFAGIRALSEDVASTPLAVYARNSNGRSVAFWHPLYALLHDQPNPVMSPQSYGEALMYSALMQGGAHAWVERSMFTLNDPLGDPIALWPLRTDRLVKQLVSGQMRYFYVDNAEDSHELDPRDIIPIPGITKDGIYGLGVHKYGAEALGAGVAAEEFSAAFFGNGTQVGGTINIPQGLVLSEKAKENLLRTIASNRKGSPNAFKAMLLEDGITWEPSKTSPKEAQMLEQRTFTVTQVAQLLRITPDKLQDLSHATYSNIEQQDINYMKWSLRPWFSRIEQAYNCFLLSDSDRAKGYYCEHITEALLVGDIKTQFEAFRTAIAGSFMSPNEVRQRLNMNKAPGGDVFLAQINQAPLTSLEHISDEQTGGASPMTLRDKADVAGVLIRSGFEPQDAARVAGLPNMDYGDVQPVTLRPVTDGVQIAPTSADKL